MPSFSPFDTTHDTGLTSVRRWWAQHQQRRRQRSTLALAQAIRTMPTNDQDTQRSNASILHSIQHGADVNAPVVLPNESKSFPLEWALARRRWTLAIAMLHAKADPNGMSLESVAWNVWDLQKGPSWMQPRPTTVPLMVQAMLTVGADETRSDDPQMWRMLDVFEQHGGRLDWQAFGVPLVHQVVQRCCVRFHEWPQHWQHALNASQVDDQGRNALHWAATRASDEDDVTALIAAGADPFQEDAHGDTPLTLLAQQLLDIDQKAFRPHMAEVMKRHADLPWERPTRTGASAWSMLINQHANDPEIQAAMAPLAHAMVAREAVALRTVIPPQHDAKSPALPPRRRL